MLAGHYGVAYALRASRPGTPLWHLFLAVQATDIAFSALAIAGIETLRINAGERGPLSLDLVSIPYTHSLLMTVVYGAACVLVAAVIGRLAAGVVLGAAVVSHWLLDAIVHVHDLPLAPWLPPSIGLGLWQMPLVGIAIELGLLAGGYLWLRRSLASRARLLGDLSFALLAVVEVLYTFQSAPSSVVSASIGAEVIYAVAILLALAIDRAVAHQHVLAIAGVQE
jgi:hypothetical protein